MSEDIGPKFKCAACGREFKWKPELAGKRAKCKCGATIEVPLKALAAPAPAPEPEVDPFDDADLPEPVTPRPYGAGATSGGAMAPPPLPPAPLACPVCNTPAPPTAVLCTACGYNFRTGVRLPSASRGQSLAYATKGAGTGGGITADTYAQAAKAAWMAPLIAFTLGCCTRGVQASSPSVALVIGGFQILLIVAGLGLGVFALIGVGKHGAPGILVPAITGLVLNVCYIGLIVVLLILVARIAPRGVVPPVGGPPTPTPPPRTIPMIPRSR